MDEARAIEAARSYFLEQPHGCAETTCVVLQEAYGLKDASDCSGAMAFNGGIAWRGSVCGVITGAAIAVGRLAGQRAQSHREAKRVTRLIIDGWIDSFYAQFGSINCRDLIGQDIHSPEGHAAFIERGVWRDTCMGQIEFAVRTLQSLREPDVWARVMTEIEHSE